MCLVKTPKIKTEDPAAATKPLPILRNPLLDGIDPVTNALRVGRQSLRIERGSGNPGVRGPTAATAPTSSPASPARSPASAIAPTGGMYSGLNIGNVIR